MSDSMNLIIAAGTGLGVVAVFCWLLWEVCSLVDVAEREEAELQKDE